MFGAVVISESYLIDKNDMCRMVRPLVVGSLFINASKLQILCWKVAWLFYCPGCWLEIERVEIKTIELEWNYCFLRSCKSLAFGQGDIVVLKKDKEIYSPNLIFLWQLVNSQILLLVWKLQKHIMTGFHVNASATRQRSSPLAKWLPSAVLGKRLILVEHFKINSHNMPFSCTFLKVDTN